MLSTSIIVGLALIKLSVFHVMLLVGWSSYRSIRHWWKSSGFCAFPSSNWTLSWHTSTQENVEWRFNCCKTTIFQLQVCNQSFSALLYG